MIFLAEFTVHDGVSPSTLYVATDPLTSPSNNFYMGRLSNAGSVERHLFASGDGVSSGTTSGRSTAGFGNLSVINGRPYGSPETIDDWLDLSFQSVVIRSLLSVNDSFSNAVTRFIARVDRMVSTRVLEEYDFAFRDRLSDLEKPLLVNVYGGTTISGGLGTADGNTDMVDVLKQKIWGRVNNAPCQPANVYDLVYQVNDGAVASIAVYDGGVALTNAGDSGSLAALLGLALIPGQYATCLNLGYFRLGGSPAGTVTADVVEGATAADRTAAQIANRMLAWFTTMYPTTAASITAASITALDTKNGAECGVLVTGSETALALISGLLNSIGGWILPQVDSETDFVVGRLDEAALEGTPIAEFDLEDNVGTSVERVETGDDGRGIPAHKVVIRYDKLGTVQKGTEVFGVVTDARRAYLAQEWRQVQATDAAVLAQYPNAPTITFDTNLTSSADAQAEANRVLALRSVKRDCYRMRLPLELAEDCEFGTTVTLISSDQRIGLGNGKQFTPIARVDNFTDPPTVTLDLWG